MKDYTIIQAELHDLDDCAFLLDQYRIFYQAKSDLNKAKQFMRERLQLQDSKVFLLRRQDQALGFAQVYPSYSSFSLAKVYILNDLFVIEEERGKGYGTILIHTVLSYASEQGCARVSLSTAKDNPAQHLYEALGFKKSSFKYYNFAM